MITAVSSSLNNFVVPFCLYLYAVFWKKHLKIYQVKYKGNYSKSLTLAIKIQQLPSTAFETRHTNYNSVERSEACSIERGVPKWQLFTVLFMLCTSNIAGNIHMQATGPSASVRVQ